MSADDDLAMDVVAAEKLKCCASCGVAEIDDIKLKPCPKCDLVEYCSDECQDEHRHIHEAACMKRVAELHDEILFKQPESSHLGDCPICYLPMPHELGAFVVETCCSQITCLGCSHASQHPVLEGGTRNRCPFCRHVVSRTDEEIAKLNMERAKLDDPIALQALGMLNWFHEDHDEAFQCLNRAAALGDSESTFDLSLMYHDGVGVERDKEKERFFLEKAAIAGHLEARFKLGHFELDCERPDRAVKHWIIAATLGHDQSIKVLKLCYEHGCLSKQDFAAVLRAFQAAVDALQSPHRTAAAADKYYTRKYLKRIDGKESCNPKRKTSMQCKVCEINNA